MAQYAIIFTANRVIVGLATQDPTPNLPEGFSAIFLENDIDLAGGPWKLDVANARVPATEQEYQDTGRSETHNQNISQQLITNFRNASLELRTRAIAVRDTLTLSAEVRQLGVSLKEYAESLALLMRRALT